MKSATVTEQVKWWSLDKSPGCVVPEYALLNQLPDCLQMTHPTCLVQLYQVLTRKWRNGPLLERE